jgi:hypothetical protein
MSPEQVDLILFEATRKSFSGSEKESIDILTQIADLAEWERNLILIVQNDTLMKTMANGLKKFAHTSLLACLKIMTIFERISTFQGFSEALKRLKIGSMCLSFLHAQIALTDVADKTFEKDKFVGYLKSHNQLMKLTISLLFNLADSPKSLRKMVNKDVMMPLSKLLERRSSDLVILILRFVRMIASQKDFWDAVPCLEIASAIANFLIRPPSAVNQSAQSKFVRVAMEILDLLIVFASHNDGMEALVESGLFERFELIAPFAELRPKLTRVLYAVSAEDCEPFRKRPILEMLAEAVRLSGEEKLFAVAVLQRLSNDPECAAIASRCPVFAGGGLKGLFLEAVSMPPESGSFLSLIRNLAEASPELVVGFDGEIVAACLGCQKNREFLRDLIAIASRSQMSPERARSFVRAQGFVQLLCRFVQTQGIGEQAMLDAAVLLSSLMMVADEEGVKVNLDLVTLVGRILLSHRADCGVQTQCMFTLARLTYHTGMRDRIFREPALLDAIVEASASKDAALKNAGTLVLDAGSCFSPEVREYLKRPRFDRFNSDWIQAMSSKE